MAQLTGGRLRSLVQRLRVNAFKLDPPLLCFTPNQTAAGSSESEMLFSFDLERGCVFFFVFI